MNKIKELRKSNKLTQKQLGLKIGVAESTISLYESGNREPDNDMLLKIADFFGVSTDYLLGRTDDEIDNIYPLPKLKPIPILGTIACGEPILADENILGYIDIESHFNADFCLFCKGDSMINARIYDGDIVLLRTQPDVEDGEIAAVLIDGEATLKRVYKMPSRIILRAENPTFPPIDISGEDLKDIRIIGKAVGFCSKL